MKKAGPTFIGSIIALIIWLVLAVIYIAAVWIIFQKAGRPGWMAIIPLLNTYILLRIVGRPGWWILLTLIPLVNIVIGIILMVGLARSFGHGVPFAIGLILLAPIFILILAFGSSQYVGPAVKPT